MSCRGNPSRCGFQRANPAKMRRHANRSAPIAPDSPRRASRSNRRRLAAARSARRPLQIPRIARLPAQRIVRLIRHQIFRRIRISQNNRARRPQPRYQRRIHERHIRLPQQRSRWRRPSRRVDTALNRQRHAMQRSYSHAARNRGLRRTRLLSRAFRIQMHKRVQFRLQLRHPFQVRVLPPPPEKISSPESPQQFLQSSQK